MQKGKLNTQGFAHIAIVLTVVVLAGVAGTGAYVYHRQHNKKADTTASKTQVSSNTNHGTTPTPSPVPDPYAGWKTYCDTVRHYCFRYPTDWSIETTSAQTTVIDSAKATEVDYLNP